MLLHFLFVQSSLSQSSLKLRIVYEDSETKASIANDLRHLLESSISKIKNLLPGAITVKSIESIKEFTERNPNFSPLISLLGNVNLTKRLNVLNETPKRGQHLILLARTLLGSGVAYSDTSCGSNTVVDVGFEDTPLNHVNIDLAIAKIIGIRDLKPKTLKSIKKHRKVFTKLKKRMKMLIKCQYLEANNSFSDQTKKTKIDNEMCKTKKSIKDNSFSHRNLFIDMQDDTEKYIQFCLELSEVSPFSSMYDDELKKCEDEVKQCQDHVISEPYGNEEDELVKSNEKKPLKKEIIIPKKNLEAITENEMDDFDDSELNLHSNKEKVDKHSTDKLDVDDPFTDKEKHDEPFTDKEKHDEPFTDKEKHDEPFTDKEKHDEPLTDKEKVEKHSTIKEKVEKHSTIKEKVEDPSTDKEKHDEPSTIKQKVKKHSTIKEKHDEPSTDKEKVEKPSIKQKLRNHSIKQKLLNRSNKVDFESSDENIENDINETGIDKKIYDSDTEIEEIEEIKEKHHNIQKKDNTINIELKTRLSDLENKVTVLQSELTKLATSDEETKKQNAENIIKNSVENNTPSSVENSAPSVVENSAPSILEKNAPSSVEIKEENLELERREPTDNQFRTQGFAQPLQKEVPMPNYNPYRAPSSTDVEPTRNQPFVSYMQQPMQQGMQQPMPQRMPQAMPQRMPQAMPQNQFFNSPPLIKNDDSYSDLRSLHSNLTDVFVNVPSQKDNDDTQNEQKLPSIMDLLKQAGQEEFFKNSHAENYSLPDDDTLKTLKQNSTMKGGGVPTSRAESLNPQDKTITVASSDLYLKKNSRVEGNDKKETDTSLNKEREGMRSPRDAPLKLGGRMLKTSH